VNKARDPGLGTRESGIRGSGLGIRGTGGPWEKFERPKIRSRIRSVERDKGLSPASDSSRRDR